MTDEHRGKRSLFTPGAGRRQVGGAGKRALFGNGMVQVSCGSCHAVVRLGATEAIRLAAGRPWIPGAERSHRVRCPACGRRSWVRMRLVRARSG